MISLLPNPGELPQDVISSNDIPVSPNKVFRALTDPEVIKQWFGTSPGSVCEAFVDLRIGGNWLFVFNSEKEKYNAVTGTYLEIEPDAKLVFSWHQEIAQNNEIIQATSESRVTMSIEHVENGSRLTVVHQGIANASGRVNVVLGWQSALQSLFDSIT